MAVPWDASRSEALRVAAGFNPRTDDSRIGMMRRGATLERCGHTRKFNRRYATSVADWRRHRGLKPTATQHFVAPQRRWTPQSQPKMFKLQRAELKLRAPNGGGPA